MDLIGALFKSGIYPERAPYSLRLNGFNLQQSAAFDKYKHVTELSKSEIARDYEITEAEAQDVIDYIRVWRAN